MRAHKSILEEFKPIDYTRTKEGLMLKDDYLKSDSQDATPIRGNKDYQPVNSISDIFSKNPAERFYLDNKCDTKEPLVAVTLDQEREKIAVITNKDKKQNFKDITIDAGGKGRGYDTKKFTEFEDKEVDAFIKTVVKSENGKN